MPVHYTLAYTHSSMAERFPLKEKVSDSISDVTPTFYVCRYEANGTRAGNTKTSNGGLFSFTLTQSSDFLYQGQIIPFGELLAKVRAWAALVGIRPLSREELIIVTISHPQDTLITLTIPS